VFLVNKEGLSASKVAATYIGVIVGAGFASGQEVLQFFARFGVYGLAGLLIITLSFIIFGYIIMDMGRILNSTSHLEITRFSAGKYIGTFIDFIVIFFLFGALTAMIAGTGALFSQQFNLSSILGNLIMAMITAVTVLTGINGVINSISFVTPFLLVSVIGISILSIINTPPVLSATTIVINQSGLISNWFLAAILYVSYNIILSIAILAPLGLKANDKKALRNGAILGGLGLGLGAIMIYLAILGNISNVASLEVPMVFIAGSVSKTVQVLYAVVLIAEVYTTAVGSLYGFSARIINLESNPLRTKLVVIVTTILAFLASQFGFSNLVKYLYPLVGYGGIALLISLVYTRLINRGDKWSTGIE
jgi:uncharacterized membrane protein YkvI